LGLKECDEFAFFKRSARFVDNPLVVSGFIREGLLIINEGRLRPAFALFGGQADTVEHAIDPLAIILDDINAPGGGNTILGVEGDQGLVDGVNEPLNILRIVGDA
jgi:hypothetical protein